VTDEDGILDVELRENFGQRVQGFVVHIADSAGLGQDGGISTTVARINSHGRPGCIGHSLREIFPVRNGTQAFVKENQFRGIGRAAWNPLHLDVMALHGQVETLFLVAHFMRIVEA
jgi:hypothetical protein